MTPVLGDFLDLADQHISAATKPTGQLPADVRHGIVGALIRLVTVMARYAADPALPDSFYPAARRRSAPDRPTALDCKLALTRAAQTIAVTGDASASLDARTAHPAEVHLRTAADCLAAARDLLQTHFPADPTGPEGAGST